MLDIRYRKTQTKPGILFTSLPIFTLRTSDYDAIFEFCVDLRHKRRHSKSATSSLRDKGTCREIDHVYHATCSNTVNMRGN